MGVIPKDSLLIAGKTSVGEVTLKSVEITLEEGICVAAEVTVGEVTFTAVETIMGEVIPTVSSVIMIAALTGVSAVVEARDVPIVVTVEVGACVVSKITLYN